MTTSPALLNGAEVRQAARALQWTGPTAGLAPGYVQANLVVTSREWAFDFLLFCQRNPKPCPLLEVTEPGCPEARLLAPGSDVRTDIPRYCVYKDGKLVEEIEDLSAYWDDDKVAFLLGCSFTFERALMDAGISIRHIEQNCNVPMYRTSLPCRSAGRFRGPLVVSMRPMHPAHALLATEICSRFPLAHGPPVHVGEPAQIGIADLGKPDYGDAVTMQPGEVPVFWACGVTPQAVVLEARPPLVLTHKPGHMFVSDLRETQLHTLQDVVR